MVDDKAKKPKIDLKARLGKTQMGLNAPAPLPTAAGPTPPPPPSEPSAMPVPGVHGVSGVPSVPPPSRPSVPVPPSSVRPPPAIAPPPGIAALSPGIPLPAFGPQPRPVARPEPKPVAAQQTIKVEIGEEIHDQRRKARRSAAMAGVVGAAIGIGIGFVAGGAAEKGDRVKSGARGAALLEKEVKTANDKLKELDTKLGEAADKLKAKSFPDDLGSALAGLTIPFDETNLDGKGVNGMTTRVFKQILEYTSACKNINKSRESLKNLVGFAKDPITKAWKEETAPIANFSVVFRNDGKNVVADLLPVASPSFPWKGDHPEKFKVSKAEGNKQVDKEVKRWVKGDLTGGDTAIPVDPKSTAAFQSEVYAGRLYKALSDIRLELKGNADDPNGSAGLLKTGDDLAVELHKVSLIQ